MDLSVFFDPIKPEILEETATLADSSWYHSINVYQHVFPDWNQSDIVLIGCTEFRGSGKASMAQAADQVRAQIYRLHPPPYESKMADLGNLKEKEDPETWYESLRYVLAELIKADKMVLLLGGSQDLSYAQFQAYEKLEKNISYVHIDGRLDLNDSEWKLDHQSFNHRILVQQNQHLFQFANLGYQSYLVPEDQKALLEKHHHSAIRYGSLYQQIEEAEPVLRMADMVSFDLSSVRFADAPGSLFPSPGGFSAFEACRLARYAGLSYHISSMSFTEFLPEYDQRNQSALLLAMMVWYFTEGFYNRRDDYPRTDRSNLRKYSVQLHATIPVIQFFEHPVSGRWWMEVPYPDALEEPFSRTRLIPCSKRDYEFAKTDDIPDRWWKMYNKLK